MGGVETGSPADNTYTAGQEYCVQPPSSPVPPDGFGATYETLNEQRAAPTTRPDLNVFRSKPPCGGESAETDLETRSRVLQAGVAFEAGNDWFERDAPGFTQAHQRTVRLDHRVLQLGRGR